MGNLWCLRFAPALLETFTPLFTRGRKQLQASCVLLWRVASQGQKFFSIIKLVFLFLRQMFLRSKPKDKSRVSDVNNFGIFMLFVSIFNLPFWPLCLYLGFFAVAMAIFSLSLILWQAFAPYHCSDFRVLRPYSFYGCGSNGFATYAGGVLPPMRWLQAVLLRPLIPYLYSYRLLFLILLSLMSHLTSFG